MNKKVCFNCDCDKADYSTEVFKVNKLICKECFDILARPLLKYFNKESGYNALLFELDGYAHSVFPQKFGYYYRAKDICKIFDVEDFDNIKIHNLGKKYKMDFWGFELRDENSTKINGLVKEIFDIEVYENFLIIPKINTRL